MSKKIFTVLLPIFLFLIIAPLVLAQENLTNTPSVTNQKKFDPTCIQNAVEKRETAVIAAYEKRVAAIKTALEQRKTALKEAWTKPTLRERVQALNRAWKNFRDARWLAQKTYNAEIRSAWQTFNTEKRACHVTESTGESSATDLAL
jgi:hypothetical protein